MPITVSHQPDPNLLSAAGYQIGAGQQREHYEQFAQRERMQQRSILANLYSQQQSQQAAADRQQAGFAFDAQQKYLQQQAMKDIQSQQMEIDRQQFADQQSYRQKQLELTQTHYENQYEADQVQFLRYATDDIQGQIKGMLDQGYTYTEDEQREYDKIQGNVRRISADESLSAAQAAQLIYREWAKAPSPSGKPRTLAEQVEWGPDPNDPTGTRQLPLVMGRDGSPVVMPGYEADKEEPPKLETLPPLERWEKDGDYRMKLQSEANKTLTDLYKTQLDAYMTAHAAASLEISPEDKAAGKTPTIGIAKPEPPTVADINAYAREMAGGPAAPKKLDLKGVLPVPMRVENGRKVADPSRVPVGAHVVNPADGKLYLKIAPNKYISQEEEGWVPPP